jgi:hypothetical protein
MMTNAMRAELRERGYTADQIKEMKRRHDANLCQ